MSKTATQLGQSHNSKICVVRNLHFIQLQKIARTFLSAFFVSQINLFKEDNKDIVFKHAIKFKKDC